MVNFFKRLVINYKSFSFILRNYQNRLNMNNFIRFYQIAKLSGYTVKIELTPLDNNSETLQTLQNIREVLKAFFNDLKYHVNGLLIYKLKDDGLLSDFGNSISSISLEKINQELLNFVNTDKVISVAGQLMINQFRKRNETSEVLIKNVANIIANLDDSNLITATQVAEAISYF